MTETVRQQAQEVLAQLPPEGLDELVRFLEFLAFKYQLASPLQSATLVEPPSVNVSSDSWTARFRGFVHSPLTVAELSAAYELNLMGDDE